MLAILDALGSIACAWGRAMQRPLHEPVPAAPSRDFTAMIDDEVEEARNRADARAAEPLLPSTDYRTNPRPSQIPVAPRCYY